MSLMLTVLLFSSLTGLPEANQAAWSNASWSEPFCLAEKAQSWDVAWYNDAVHVVWILEQKMYWRMQPRGGDWTEPVVISVRANNFPDLVAGEKSLHLIWLQEMNIGYKVYDGKTWTTEESVFPELHSVHGDRLAVMNDRPIVFFSSYEFGMLPHTPGSYPLMLSIRKDGGWSSPRAIPSASSVDDGLISVLTTDDATIHLVWLQEHRGYLFRNFGIGSKDCLRTFEYLSLDAEGGQKGKQVTLGTVSKLVTRLGDLAAIPSGEVAVMWIDGSSDAEGVSLRIKKAGQQGAWRARHLFEGDKKRRPFHATVAGTSRNIVLVTNAEQREESRKIEAIVMDDNREIARSRSPFEWLLDVPRTVVSPDGSVHMLGNRIRHGLCYCRITP